MARCTECFHYEVCAKECRMVQIYEHTWDDYNQLDNVEKFCANYIPTADVAPKSEVEALGREVERLTNILNSYALQYGTVKDQHEVIDKAKAEAVKEFAEYLKKYYCHIDKTAGALIEYTIDKKVKAFLGKEGVDDD